jgi:hypothetical protein
VDDRLDDRQAPVGSEVKSFEPARLVGELEPQSAAVEVTAAGDDRSALWAS